MFGKHWSLSPREHSVRRYDDFEIPLDDGGKLVGNLFRPETDEPVPLLLGFHPYNNEFQVAPIKPAGFGLQRGWMEAGDPNFFARRGYAHGIFNVGGTGKSSGVFDFMGPTEAEQVVEAIAWLAAQPWCSGAIGMFGVSYFSRVAIQVATRQPPALKAIFAPYGLTDIYRDLAYHGGILSHGFLAGWRDKLDGLRYESLYRKEYGDEAHAAAIAAAINDDEIMALAPLREALLSPEGPRNAFLSDVLAEPFDGKLFQARRVEYNETTIPAYFGACWGLYGLQLSAAFRNYEHWQGPKKLLIGPPYYLDRPLYQLQYESLRWFDHWLKDNDTGVMDEPPVRFFMDDDGSWTSAEEWPLPQTRWTPFYLHDDQLLSEHELWDWENSSSYEDSPFLHGNVTFRTPKFIERTEVVGPLKLELYLSTTDVDALVFASVFVVGTDGAELELTRGWLRASQRETDDQRSTPWLPEHLHRGREELVPGEVCRLEVAIAPLGRRFAPGERLGLRIKSADDEARPDPLRATGFGHVARQTASRVTIHHRSDLPSRLLVPVTAGNHLETYLSEGRLEAPGPLPLAKIQRVKVSALPSGQSAGSGDSR